MNARRSPDVAGRLRSSTGLVLVAVLLIAGFFLVTEHTAHTFRNRRWVTFDLASGALVRPRGRVPAGIGP